MYNIDFCVFSLIIIFRLTGAFIVQTAFVPDEYWQSLEVAHKLTFGYGHLTWEWEKKIRSYTYPLVFYTLYSILPDTVEVMVLAPKIFQAALSAMGDFCIYKLAARHFGKSCSYWTVFNLLSSWFLFYCSPRTLTNMAEATLSCFGLYCYPWGKKDQRLTLSYLWFAGASALVRPTAVILWLPLYGWHMWRESYFLKSLRRTFFIGFVLLAVLAVCDRWCYGEWVFTPLNFFLFNFTSDIGAFYGSHNVFWYLTVGLPTVLSAHIFPFVIGAFLPQLRPMYLLVAWVIFVLSIPSHKEFRFLLPVLHLCLLVSSVVMNEIFKHRPRFRGAVVCLILSVNIPLSVYVGLFHQRGVIDVTFYLSGVVEKSSSVLFLMPCHSTPYYSYVHKNVSMKFLRCEPNFQESDSYVNEADEFFADPHEWLSKNCDSGLLPSHLVMFDTAHSYASSFLHQHRYRLCFAAFHSHFPQERTGKSVRVYCRK